MIYLKVNTKSYRTLDYKKSIVNKMKTKKGRLKIVFQTAFYLSMLRRRCFVPAERCFQ